MALIKDFMPRDMLQIGKKTKSGMSTNLLRNMHKVT